MKLGLARLALLAVLPSALFALCQGPNLAALHSANRTTTPIKHLVVIFGEISPLTTTLERTQMPRIFPASGHFSRHGIRRG